MKKRQQQALSQSRTELGKSDTSKRWMFELALVIASVIGGGVVTYLLMVHSGRMRYLDLLSTINKGILSVPDLGGQIVRIQVDDRQIDNMSVASLKVYNLSDQDYDDVVLNLRIESLERQPYHLLSTSYAALGAMLGPEIKHVSSTSPIVLHWKIPVVNRSPEPVFTAQLVFAGSDPPEVKLTVRKKGLSIRPLRLESFDWFQMLAALFAGVATGAVTVSIGVTLGRKLHELKVARAN